MPNIDARTITIPGNNEVSDLIGNPPSWLLRSGITMMAIVVISILSVTYFIKYPDKIVGAGSMTAESPPIELISRSNGYIKEILVTEGQEVNEGDQLFYISNTSNPDEIKILTEWIVEYETITDPRKYLNTQVPPDLQLGSLQTDYASLQLKFNEMKQTLRNGIVFQQMNNISEEIIKIRSLNKSQRREKEIYSAELELERKDFNRNKSLEVDGVISTQELEKANTNLLQKQRQFESMENAIIQNNIRIEQLELEKLKMQGDRADLVKNYQFAINEIVARVRSNIENWNQTYTIYAPISGTATLPTQMYENMVIKTDQSVGHIMPENQKEKYFTCNIPIQNTGKMEAGQKALIKLDAYPYKQNGMIVSSVSAISSLPISDQEGNKYYKIQINLPDTIYTDMGALIPYKPNMTAQVEIITEDKTILQRIFNQFISLIKQQDI